MSAVPRWAMHSPFPAHALREQGFIVLPPDQFAHAAGVPLPTLRSWPAHWEDLPPDTFLRDGGAYRFRRHSSFVHDTLAGTVDQVAHRAHWQPTSYNALHGGIERWFEPMEAALAGQPAWLELLAGLGRLFNEAGPAPRWYIEAHQFRIDTASGVGRPTPEGAHRDGVDFVAVVLVDRRNVRGGETRIFDAHGPHGIRFALTEPWTAVLLDDARVIHETTPIQPDAPGGHRDTLVLTYRRGGFQDPQQP